MTDFQLSISLSRPLGTHSWISLCHGTAPSACNVLFISHPFRVINSSPLYAPLVQGRTDYCLYLLMPFLGVFEQSTYIIKQGGP